MRADNAVFSRLMKQWFKKLQLWHSQRHVRSLAQWDRERAKGKARFVLRTGLIYITLIIPTHDYVAYLVDGEMPSWQLLNFLFRAVGYSITGAVIGLFSWASREGEYKKALLEGRIKPALGPAPLESPLPQKQTSHTPARRGL